MGKLKKLIILLCVLVAACLATFALTRYEEEKEIIRNSDEIILEVNPEDVQAFSWEYGEENLAFHRSEDGTWLWDEDDAFPVNEDVMRDFLETFQAFGATFAIESVADYSQYGLDKPECTIRISTADTEYTVTLGGFSKMDAQRYVSIGDGNAYLIGADPLEDFQITIRDMIDNDKVPTFEQVNTITFEGLAGYTVNYEEESTKSYCAEDVYFTGSLPLDTDRVEDYLDELEYLSLTNFATYNATEEELALFGMDAPELTVTVDYTYENGDQVETVDAFTLYISRDPIAAAEAEAAEEGDEIEVKCYVRIGESPIVYEISQSLYDILTKVSYNDLRHTDLISADFEDIVQVDVTYEETSYTLATTLETVNEDGETEVVDAGDDEIHWYYDGEEIDIASFKSAVINLIAEDFTEEKPAGKEEISVTFHLRNENFPSVKLQLYRYDGNDCIAVIDGEPTALIDRVYAVDLIEAFLALVL